MFTLILRWDMANILFILPRMKLALGSATGQTLWENLQMKTQHLRFMGPFCYKLMR